MFNLIDPTYVLLHITHIALTGTLDTLKYTEHIIIGVIYTQRSCVFRVLYVFIHVEITHIAQEHM